MITKNGWLRLRNAWQLDLAVIEKGLLHRPEWRQVEHPYSDDPLPIRGVACYTIVELFAENYVRSLNAADPGDCTTSCTCTATPIYSGAAKQSSKSWKANVSTRELLSRRFRRFIPANSASISSSSGSTCSPTNFPAHTGIRNILNELGDVFSWLAGGPPPPILPRAEQGC